jgi:hypothetical protein
VHLGHGAASRRRRGSISAATRNDARRSRLGGAIPAARTSESVRRHEAGVSRRNIVLALADEHYSIRREPTPRSRSPLSRGQPCRRASRRSSKRSQTSRATAARRCSKNGLAVTTTLDAKLQDLAGRDRARSPDYTSASWRNPRAASSTRSKLSRRPARNAGAGRLPSATSPDGAAVRRGAAHREISRRPDATATS